jgi:putative transposase
MYRVLAAQQEVRERRQQLRHPRYAAPELLARRPNELWSWDITQLLGPAKWTYFYLYVLLDVFSRYVVGWMVAHRETATLPERFIGETCARYGIGRDQLTIHADRGQAMISKSVAFLLADLGVTKTHSRPHVSNDNPFSEAQFKPRWTPENRPVVDGSNPASGRAPRARVFYSGRS